jgi:hypothetical protein
VGRVADQQYPVGPESFGQPGVPAGETPQQVRAGPLGLPHGEVGAEHAADRRAQFGDRERRVDIRFADLGHAQQLPAVRERREREESPFRAVVQERRDDAVAGHREAARRRVDQLLRHPDVRGPRHRAIVADPGKVDAGELAGHAAAAIRAHQVTRPQLVRSLGPVHLDRDGVVPLRQPDQLMAAADLDAQLCGAFREHLYDPALRDHQQVHRIVGQLAEVQRERGEHEPRRRPRRSGRAAEPLVQATPVDHPDDLADDAVGALLARRFGQPFQHQRPDSGQGELTGQHEAVRPCARDDNV